VNGTDFNNIAEKRLSKCKSILVSKNKEYSSDTDRLHNFKVAGRVSGVTPEKALLGMCSPSIWYQLWIY